MSNIKIKSCEMNSPLVKDDKNIAFKDFIKILISRNKVSKNKVSNLFGFRLTTIFFFVYSLLPVLLFAQDIKTNYYNLKIEGLSADVKLTHDVKKITEDLEILTFNFETENPIHFPKITITWKIIATNIQTVWTTSDTKGVSPDWGAYSVKSRATAQAPVMSLIGNDNDNRFTFAVSDALNAVTLSAGVREEDAHLVNKVILFDAPHPKISSYTIEIRLDKRNIKYWDALKDGGKVLRITKPLPFLIWHVNRCILRGTVFIKT